MHIPYSILWGQVIGEALLGVSAEILPARKVRIRHDTNISKRKFDSHSHCACHKHTEKEKEIQENNYTKYILFPQILFIAAQTL